MTSRYHSAIFSDLDRLKQCEERRLQLQAEYYDLLKGLKVQSNNHLDNVMGNWNALINKVDGVSHRLDQIADRLAPLESSLKDEKLRFEQCVRKVFPDIDMEETGEMLSKKPPPSSIKLINSVDVPDHREPKLTYLNNVDFMSTSDSMDQTRPDIPKLHLSKLQSTNNTTVNDRWKDNSMSLRSTETETTLNSNTMISSFNATHLSNSHEDSPTSQETVLKKGPIYSSNNPELAATLNSAVVYETSESFNDKSYEQTGTSVTKSDDNSSFALGSSTHLSVQGVFNILSAIERSVASGARLNYYDETGVSPQQKLAVCDNANNSSSNELTVSLTSAGAVLLDEIPMICHTFTHRCVIPDSALDSISRRGLSSAHQIEEELTKSVSDDAQTLWIKLLHHMKFLVARKAANPSKLSQQFSPLLIHRNAQLERSMVSFLSVILESVPFSTVMSSVLSDDDDDSTTLPSTSLKVDANNKVVATIHGGKNNLGGSLMATAGSFRDVDSSSELEHIETVQENDHLSITADAQLKAYAAALDTVDTDEDDSSFNEVDLENNKFNTTTLSNWQTRSDEADVYDSAVVSNNVKESTAYQAFVSSTAVTRQLSEDDNEHDDILVASGTFTKSTSSAPGTTNVKANTSGLKTTQEILKSVNRDSDFDTDSDMENSFAGKLSRSHQPATPLVKSGVALKETEDDDFDDFYGS